MKHTPIHWLTQTATDVPAADHWLAASESATLERLRIPKRRGDWRLGRWTAKRAVLAYLAERRAAWPLGRIEIRATEGGAPEVVVDRRHRTHRRSQRSLRCRLLHRRGAREDRPRTCSWSTRTRHTHVERQGERPEGASRRTQAGYSVGCRHRARPGTGLRLAPDVCSVRRYGPGIRRLVASRPALYARDGRLPESLPAGVSGGDQHCRVSSTLR
jgi:hypothetical protein